MDAAGCGDVAHAPSLLSSRARANAEVQLGRAEDASREKLDLRTCGAAGSRAAPLSLIIPPRLALSLEQPEYKVEFGGQRGLGVTSVSPSLPVPCLWELHTTLPSSLDCPGA